jgi:menaquinone-dependent protoporphyrinogen IX oxidase
MSQNKTLIAYQTKLGAAEETARKIAQVLRAKYNFEVDLVDLKEQGAPDLAQYRNIVVGGGVMGGRIYGKVLKLLESDLTGKRVAFFTCSSWAGTPGSYENAKTRFIEKTLAKYPKINSVGAEAFGGRIRMLRKTMLDNTDMSKVEAWAEEIGKKFQ